MPSGITGDYGPGRSAQYQAQTASTNSTPNAGQTRTARGDTAAPTQTGGPENGGTPAASKAQAQLRDIGATLRNTQEGIGLTQAGASTLRQASNTLRQMREAAVQASSPTATSEVRTAAGNTFGQLANEIDRVGSTNQRAMSSRTGPAAAQVGNNPLMGGSGGNALSTQNLGLSGQGARGLDLTTAAGARAAVATVDQALGSVAEADKGLSALRDRFSAAISGATDKLAGLSGSEGGRITGSEMAREAAQVARSQILGRSGQAFQAQGNISQSSALALLG